RARAADLARDRPALDGVEHHALARQARQRGLEAREPEGDRPQPEESRGRPGVPPQPALPRDVRTGNIHGASFASSKSSTGSDPEDKSIRRVMLARRRGGRETGGVPLPGCARPGSGTEKTLWT